MEDRGRLGYRLNHVQIELITFVKHREATDGTRGGKVCIRRTAMTAYRMWFLESYKVHFRSRERSGMIEPVISTVTDRIYLVIHEVYFSGYYSLCLSLFFH